MLSKNNLKEFFLPHLLLLQDCDNNKNENNNNQPKERKNKEES
jgi:hypothetical protein